MINGTFGGVAYKVGMIQPGVVALKGDDIENLDVLVTWGVTPTEHNMGGAMGRPDPETQVFKSVKMALNGDYSMSKLAAVQDDLGMNPEASLDI